jgi:predicted PurR-regulated permease PerM
VTPAVEAMVWTLVIIAFLFAAGGLVIFGKFVKLISTTNFWLRNLHEDQRQIIANQNSTARILNKKDNPL